MIVGFSVMRQQNKDASLSSDMFLQNYIPYTWRPIDYLQSSLFFLGLNAFCRSSRLSFPASVIFVFAASVIVSQTPKLCQARAPQCFTEVLFGSPKFIYIERVTGPTGKHCMYSTTMCVGLQQHFLRPHKRVSPAHWFLLKIRIT